MDGLLIVELLVIALLVIVAAIGLWRSRARGDDLVRPAPRAPVSQGPSRPIDGRDGEEPTVLSVDLRDRDP